MREDRSRDRLYGLDHLRTLAILLVLLYHYRAFKHPEWIDTIGQFGWTGVDLFFVLSGFLISSQLFEELNNSGDFNLRTFFTKRVFRIMPPYFFTVFLYFCFPFFREREALSSLWKFLTFTQNYGLDVINRGTFSHAWSLCIEEQFYLVLPLLLLLTAKTKMFSYLPFFLVILILFSVIMRCVVWQSDIESSIGTDDFWRLWYMEIYYPTHTRLDGLAVGVFIGYLLQCSSKFNTTVHNNGNILFIVGVVLLSILFWMCREQTSREASIFGFTFVAISYGFIVMSAISKTSFLNKTKLYITTQLAGLSYAIYLSHKGIIHIVQSGLTHFKIEPSGGISLFLCLLGCIGGGLFYRFIIENPSTKLKFRILNRKNNL